MQAPSKTTVRRDSFAPTFTYEMMVCIPMQHHRKGCQTCDQGGSQACGPACNWRAHSCGPCGACAALQSQILPLEEVAHRTCFSVEPNTHPNRQFLAHFVVHAPLCLHVLFRVTHHLHSNRGCKGTVTWGILGYVPSRVRLTMQGGGVGTHLTRSCHVPANDGGTLGTYRYPCWPPKHVSLREKHRPRSQCRVVEKAGAPADRKHRGWPHTLLDHQD